MVSWQAFTDEPVWAAAPGQAAVLYDGDVVLGGGRIGRPDAAWGGRAAAESGPAPARGSGGGGVIIEPAPILALLVGILRTSLFVLIRGSGGGQFHSCCWRPCSAPGPATQSAPDLASTCCVMVISGC